MSRRRIVENIENIDMYEVPGVETGEKDVEIVLRGYSFGKRVLSKRKKRSKKKSKSPKTSRIKRNSHIKKKSRSRKTNRKRKQTRKSRY